MLRIATANVNGIRAAHRRGFDDWLATRGCDVVTLQEVRCPVDALPEGAFGDFHATYDAGQLAGRNGVAVLTRQPPAAVRTWADPDPARPLPRALRKHVTEGRYVEVDLADVPLTVASLYLPKGGLPAHLQRPVPSKDSQEQPRRMREAPDGGAKYQRKMDFLAGFARYLAATRKAAAAQGREFLLTGDLNVAHQPQDVAAFKRSNQVEGFLPEEREWIGTQINPRTLVDVVRQLHGDAQGPYSWWSWLGRAYDEDRGWRIDYHLATPRLARTARSFQVDRNHLGVRMSDHAPVVVDYDGPFGG